MKIHAVSGRWMLDDEGVCPGSHSCRSEHFRVLKPARPEKRFASFVWGHRVARARRIMNGDRTQAGRVSDFQLMSDRLRYLGLPVAQPLCYV